MSDLVNGSKFLKSNGYWESCYYAIDTLTEDEIFNGLISCGVWYELDTNPAIDLVAALELAESQEVFRDRCLKRYEDENGHWWVVCDSAYGGGYDILSFGHTIQKAICLYILRFPEIDLRNHGLPYEGWIVRYDDE